MSNSFVVYTLCLINAQVFAISITMKGIRATALDNYTCAATEEVFQSNAPLLMVCLAECVSKTACKSVAYKSNSCRGCSNHHFVPELLEELIGTVFYNKVSGYALYGEDCALNSCTEPNQVCEYDSSAQNYKCECELGTTVTTESTCVKTHALDREDCSVLPCFSLQNTVCNTGSCQCTNGAKYFPDMGQCQIATRTYQQPCGNDFCMGNNQICLDSSNKCECDHGYKYNGTACLTECSSYGTTYQLYDKWRILLHPIHTIYTPFIDECKSWCSVNADCRSFSVSIIYIVFVATPITCFFHDVTALNVVPFWEYRIEIFWPFQHYVRNCYIAPELP